MTTMVTEVYDALRSIGVADDKAARAAEAMATLEPQLAAIRSDLVVLKWMIGTLYPLVLAILVKLFLP